MNPVRYAELMREEAAYLEKERKKAERLNRKKYGHVKKASEKRTGANTNKKGSKMNATNSNGCDNKAYAGDLSCPKCAPSPPSNKSTATSLNPQLPTEAPEVTRLHTSPHDSKVLASSSQIHGPSENTHDTMIGVKRMCPVRGCKKLYQSVKTLRSHITKQHPKSLAAQVIREDAGNPKFSARGPVAKKRKTDAVSKSVSKSNSNRTTDQEDNVSGEHQDSCPARMKQRQALRERISIQCNLNKDDSPPSIQQLFSSAILDFVSDFLAVNNLPSTAFEIGSLVYLHKACTLSFQQQHGSEPSLPVTFEKSDYKALAALLWEQMASMPRV